MFFLFGQLKKHAIRAIFEMEKKFVRQSKLAKIALFKFDAKNWLKMYTSVSLNIKFDQGEFQLNYFVS